MPLEFLLAVHIATMAPDLSYKMATSFDTDVEILLYGSTNGDIDAAVQYAGDESTRTLRTELAQLNNSVWTNVWDFADQISLNESEIREIFEKTKIKSYTGDNAEFKCIGPPSEDCIISFKYNEVEEDVQKLNDHFARQIETLDGSVPKEEQETLYNNILGGTEGEWNLTITYNGEEIEVIEKLTKEIENEQEYYTFSINKISDLTGVLCSDEANNTGKVCTPCNNFVSLIYESLNQIKKDDLETWVPYINKVTKHWYRDIYFTKGALNEDGIKSVIQNDDEYEKKTGERWTLYETFTDSDGNMDYELYVYLKNSDGNYNDEMENNLVCKKVKKGKGNYKLADDGITYLKTDKGDYKLQTKNGENDYSDYSQTPDEFRVGKKAILQSVDELWDKTGGVGAYEVGQSTSKWQTLESADSTEINQLKDLGMEFLYKLEIPVVKQVEDGVRTETNPVIKKLFLDDYYIYDGTGGTAALIQKAKQMVMDKTYDIDDLSAVDDPDTFKKLFGKNKKISATYAGKKYTATIDQISSAISLSHTSLSAFSILENMHTLDAEYIYHDFKELIVELNYFDKEDLTEAADTVMMFPVAGISSAGWPVVRYDKGENFYGTLIHSAEDLEANMEEQKLENLKISQLNQADVEGDSTPENTSSSSTDSTSTNSNKNVNFNGSNVQKNSTAGTDETNNVYYSTTTVSGITYKNYKQGLASGSFASGASISGCGCGPTSVAILLDAYGITKDIKEVGDNLGTNGDGSNRNNIPNTIEAMSEGKITAVSTGFGSGQTEQCFDAIMKAFSEGKPVICNIARPSNTQGCLDPGYFSGTGHFICLIGIDSATNELIISDPGKDYGESAGSGVNTYPDLRNFIQYYMTDNCSKCGSRGIVVPDQAPDGVDIGSIQNTFAGYEGGEAVVAPVSGQVIKYGTVTRKNEITGEDNEVGFIKIKVLDQGLPGKGCNYFVSNHKSVTGGNGKKYSKGELTASEWLEDKYSEDELKNLGYDYFWEEYNEAGICGHVLYIEGIDVTDILGDSVDTSKNNNGNIETLAQYIAKDDTPNSYKTAYKVPNLLDDRREFELKVGEEAKKQADYVLTKEGKVFIKEGAVIGKTYTSDNESITKKTKVEVLDETEEPSDGSTTDTNSNSSTTNSNSTDTTEENEIATKKKKYNLGNYMRIIFRDNDDEVVENVEDYIEIGSGGSKIESDVSEELLFFLGVLEEGACTEEWDLGSNYLSKSIGDSAAGSGKTTAFGLTESIKDIVKDMYPDFASHVAAGSVPKQEAQDSFVIVVEAARESVLEKITDTNALTEETLNALIDLHHMTPERAIRLCEKFNSTKSLTVQDFENEWGSWDEAETALKNRAHNRGILSTTGVYQRYNGSHGPNTVVNFNSETPWSDFCSGSQVESLYSESGGGN